MPKRSACLNLKFFEYYDLLCKIHPYLMVLVFVLSLHGVCFFLLIFRKLWVITMTDT